MSVGGEIFQHYRVLRRDDGRLWELGRGAMGVTYKAIDTNLDAIVALKVINALFLDEDSARARFRREAKAAASLHHPNVASVFHLGSDEANFFYAMEFIDGETVESLVKRTGPLPWRDALEIAHGVASALTAAHVRKLVHRDIKPANVMLIAGGEDEPRRTVKLIDFGLAKAVVEEGGTLVNTNTTGFLGTPSYASPEQCDELAPDIRSDIYSLGVTLWFTLAGQPPFTGSLGQVFAQHLHKPPPFEKLPAEVPEAVRALLACMLAKNRAERPQTPAEVRREIEACQRGQPTAVPDLGKPSVVSPVSLPEVAVAAPVAPPAAVAIPAALPPDVPPVTEPSLSTAKTHLRATSQPPSGLPLFRRHRPLLVGALAGMLVLAATAGWYWGMDLPQRRANEAARLAGVAHDAQARSEALAEEQRRKEAAEAEAEAARERQLVEQEASANQMPKTLLVPDNFPTIQAAIDAARARDTVQVRAGEYQEELKFKPGIVLRGEGTDKVFVRSRGKSVVLLVVAACQAGTISDLSFEHLGSRDPSRRPPLVRLSGSAVELFRCRMRYSGGEGLVIRGRDRSSVHDCEVSGSAMNGISVSEAGTAPTLKNNVARENSTHGIYFGERSGGVAEANLAEANGNSGLVVDDTGTAPRVQGNRCLNNGRWGIYVARNATPILAADNKAVGNKNGQIYR